MRLHCRAIVCPYYITSYQYYRKDRKEWRGVIVCDGGNCLRKPAAEAYQYTADYCGTFCYKKCPIAEELGKEYEEE